MGTEGTNGGLDGSGKRPDFERTNTVREIKDSLVKIDFLDKSSERVGEIREEVKKIIKGKLGLESVEEISEDKDKKSILIEATSEAMREVSAHNISLNDEFYLGSAHMGKILSRSGLQGIAADVSREYVSVAPIDKTLNTLEIMRQSAISSGRPGAKEALVQNIGMTVAKILGMQLKDEDVPVQFAVLATLNEENAVLKTELGDVNSGVRMVVEQKTQRATKTPEKSDGNESKEKQRTKQQIISDEVKKFVEDSFKSAGGEIVDTSEVLRKAVDMFKNKLEYSGDAIVLAADVFLETIGKFETSTLDVIKAQTRLVEVTKKISEMESYGDLSTDDLLKIIQETRGSMTDEEKVKETAKSRLDESANLSALIFVGELPASFKELYGKMSPDMRAYWDRKIAERKANLEAMKGSGADPAMVDGLYREMESLLSSKSGGERYERGENLKASLDDVEKWLLEIETSLQPSNDISLNSDKLRKLYFVINGDIKIEGISDQERLRTIDWIKSRLLINDWFLSASTSHTIEDIFKTIARTHQGDVDSKMDTKLLKVTLDSREKIKGFELELPTDEAWNLRQRAYHMYVTDVDTIAEKKPNGDEIIKYKAKEGYLKELWLKYNDFITRELIRNGAIEVRPGDKTSDTIKKAENVFLEVSKLMSKSDEYGIDKDYYTNLRNDSLLRKSIVEMCMAKELEKYIIVGGDRSEVEKTKKRWERAVRAVEIAKRESVIFYQDSLANIAFADADDYAEIVNFKFIRYQDMVENAKKGGQPKGKPMGYIKIIKYINSLTAPYLHTLMKGKNDRKNVGGLNPVDVMLEANDIDFDAMDPKSTMLYHIGSIVFKKVLPTQQMLLKAQSPKDFEDIQELMRRYDQINKTVKEADDKGWSLLDLKRNGAETYDVYQKQELMRMWYLATTFGVAVDNNGSGFEDEGVLASIEDKVIKKKLPGDKHFLSKTLWEYLFLGDRKIVERIGGETIRRKVRGFDFDNLLYECRRKKRKFQSRSMR